MRSTAAIILTFGLLLTACSSVTPVAIRAGDVCQSCGRTIVNVQLAGEALSPSGQPMKFRTVSCMAKYLTQHPDPTQVVFVTDYPTGRMVRAQNATFVRATIDQATRERDYYAFANVRNAIEFGQARETSPIDWFAIMQQIAASKTLN